MTDNHIRIRRAPDPVGDVVPGDPPVPITVWPVPAPLPGETMSNGTGVRLVHNLTHIGDLVIDLTDGPQLARAIINGHRRSHLQSAKTIGWGKHRAPLIVTSWPIYRPADEFFTVCEAKLVAGGCVAVLLPHGNPTLPSDVVSAAKTAGLSYLQHIVAAEHRQRRGVLTIHTDILVMTRSKNTAGDGNE